MPLSFRLPGRRPSDVRDRLGILTGFEFGTRKTKTFSARLYDKTADIAAKGTSGGTRSGVTGTTAECPSIGWSSRSDARV